MNAMLEIPTTTRLFGSTLVLASIMSAAAAAAGEDAAPQRWQSLEAIRTAAQEHVAESASGARGASRFEAAELDSRLRLPACQTPLRTETPWSASRGGRITVRVSCEAEDQWRVHVPVEMTVIGEVVMSTRALARGAVLTLEDITVAEQPLGPLGHGFFADPRNVVGQRLKRPLPPGSVLTPSQLEAPPLIRRGQNVTIVANSGGIDVKMNGTALENGAVGQIIDIENNSSGRRVQGIVRSARAVEILLR